MECFVDFCEDAIFEMQHSASLIETEDGDGKVVNFMILDLKLFFVRLSGAKDRLCQRRMSQEES